MELAAEELDDSGSCEPHSELLSWLHDRRLSWEEVKWKGVVRLELENDCTAYEFVAGAFVMSGGQDRKVIWLPAAKMDHHHLNLRLLGERLHFKLPTAGQYVRLHIQTISSSDKHSLALKETLEFDIGLDNSYGNAIVTPLLEIAVDIVALFFKSRAATYNARLLLWDWRKGILLYDSEFFRGTFPSTVHHFVLLSQDSFMLTSTVHGGAILLYSFVPTSPTLSMLELCATLHLPPIHSSCRVQALTSHSGPICARPPVSAPFSTAPESHLQVLSVLYGIHGRRNQESASYNIFVHKRTLMSYINRYRQAKPPIRSADVAWDTWGEMDTRFIPIRTPRTWLRYVHGQRVVSNFPGSTTIEVLDFNVSPYTAIKSSRSRRRLHSQDEPSTRYPKHLFQKDFLTRLPYYSTARGWYELLRLYD